MEKLVSPGQREPKRGVLSDDIRGDSSGWIAAFQVHAHAAVTQTYGWPIRGAVGFHRGLHASYFPESVSARKEWRGTSVEGKSSVEWRGSDDAEQRSDEGGGARGGGGKRKQ